ncbi:MAG: aldo/keto reductase [Verrucomicrobia bacterium]|nr:aldo/keto reductase [Verrucomicrobiota bacterium]
MHYRTLGRTGLKISVVGVGTWQFGGEWGVDFTQPEVDAIFAAAQDCGINFIDTAECYGDHLSERFIGNAIAGQREKWIVATKFGHHFHKNFDRTRHFDAADVVRQLDDSLKALRTDYVDLLQCHSAEDAEFDTDGLWATLQREQAKGKVRHLGLSISPQTNLYQTERAKAVGAGAIQVVYNRLQREAEAQVLPACQRDNLGVLARVPLASGFLSGKYKPGAVFAAGDVREAWMKTDRDTKLAEVQRIAATEVPAGVPMAQWALAWCLKNPVVTAVIPGCKNPAQVRANAAAAELL